MFVGAFVPYRKTSFNCSGKSFIFVTFPSTHTLICRDKQSCMVPICIIFPYLQSKTKMPVVDLVMTSTFSAVKTFFTDKPASRTNLRLRITYWSIVVYMPAQLSVQSTFIFTLPLLWVLALVVNKRKSFGFTRRCGWYIEATFFKKYAISPLESYL